MNTEKFTQGEWFFEGENEVNTEQKNICRCIRLGMEAEEMKANAALISAAPEMYRVLEHIQTFLNGNLLYMPIRTDIKHMQYEFQLKRVEAILKKARGEE